jgi:hypothetical protein
MEANLIADDGAVNLGAATGSAPRKDVAPVSHSSFFRAKQIEMLKEFAEGKTRQTVLSRCRSFAHFTARNASVSRVSLSVTRGRVPTHSAAGAR